MNQQDLRKMLEDVSEGKMTPADAYSKIHFAPINDIGIAKIDTERGIRQGVSEVIYGAGKTAEQITLIAEKMLLSGQKAIMITRVSRDKIDYVASHMEDTELVILPDIAAKDVFVNNSDKVSIFYSPIAELAIIGELPETYGIGKVVIATGGTSDLYVAEEAALTAMALGNEVERIYDAGVAGIHRLLAHTDKIMSASVIIAIAGMEGALASVVAGLADCPVIAVPTSVGYGASFGGLSALLSMLNSCASGVSVVNIDNGFGAGYQASMINHLPMSKQ